MIEYNYPIKYGGNVFHNIYDTVFFSAWDSGALTIHKLCSKGDMIAVNAVARQEKWNDSNGQPRQKVAFRVQNFRVFKDRDADDTE